MLPRAFGKGDAVPKTSVVMPVYNTEKYLADAIRSVLAQTQRVDEIIVVDDGSTDASAAIANSFGGAVRVHTQPHGGASLARNVGAQMAQSEWVAFVDADDLWLPEKIELQCKALAENPDVAMAFGMVEQFISPDVEMNAKIPERAIPGIYAGALLLRRADFYRVGEFAGWNQVEFIDWYARAVELGLRSVVLPQVVVRRRIHRANQTIAYPERKAEYARVLKAALDRRRAKK